MLNSSNPEKLSTKNQSLFPPRWGHTAILSKDDIILYGGFSIHLNQEYYYNDVISFNLPSQTFNEIKPNNSLPKRSNHSAILYNNQMIVHGGKDNVFVYNDTFSVNLQTNECVKLEINSDDIPIERTYHTANVYKNWMIVFGGEVNNEVLDDIWAMDLNSNKWLKIPFNDKRLEPRSFHSAEFLGNKLYLVGGYYLEAKCVLPITIVDFKDFSFNSPIVTLSKADSVNPVPRWGSLMKAYNNNLYLFGGRNGYDSNEIHMFSKNKWQEVKFTNNTIPPRRRAQGIIYQGSFIIIGGFGNQFYNDVYIVSLSNVRESNNLVTELRSFINNKENSDITIINAKNKYYAHSTLFFSRISCIDIAKNPDIANIKNKKAMVLDLTQYNTEDRIILNLLELLYVGRFSNAKYEYEIYELWELLLKLRLTNTKDKVLQFALYNYPKELKADSNDMAKFKASNEILLNPKRGNVILRLNTFLDIEGFYSGYNKGVIENMMMFRNRPLYFHRNYIEELLAFIPRDTLDNIIRFVMNNEIKDFSIAEICKAIDLLFFADYFCFYSLVEVKKI
jgi:N-acetylneuraminic acid mutarotase